MKHNASHNTAVNEKTPSCRRLRQKLIHKALLGTVLAAAIFLSGEGYHNDPLDYLLSLASLGANVSSIYVQLTTTDEDEEQRGSPT